ncbi:cytidine deaminase [Phorcysia thermohydrogeniphila]|uniref:Cytidine deaminase n=1 Tax=Phorcysia thermohydrogeniphila TaxID=936138 RepID=A0A4R1GIF5_9BACT|nr:cytidine deaminase [Phorcysia thermohydrogeniphila]TCK04032.1 cytidine deaminase [Phorcysia thermohydrogeniphila]
MARGIEGRTDFRKLLKLAQKAVKNSYCPYSNFRVSAVLFGEDGTVTGVNVENASYGLTVCAERVAIFKAVSEGKRKFRGILIYSPDGMPYPCGACRQVMTEFFPTDFEILVTNGSSEERFTLKELFPYNFKL